jgi:hypothetical protein
MLAEGPTARSVFAKGSGAGIAGVERRAAGEVRETNPISYTAKEKPAPHAGRADLTSKFSHQAAWEVKNPLREGELLVDPLRR